MNSDVINFLVLYILKQFMLFFVPTGVIYFTVLAFRRLTKI